MKFSSIALGLVCLSTVSFAKPEVNQRSLGGGFVQASNSGSKAIALEALPAAIRHTADVTLGGYGAGYSLMSAQIDFDDVIAIYEVKAMSADGKTLEVDIDLSGKVEELEIQVERSEIPAPVLEALTKFAPDFQAAQETPQYEKSLRPSKNGLLEVWYEFSGTNYDVEIRSDAKVVVIEPA